MIGKKFKALALITAAVMTMGSTAVTASAYVPSIMDFKDVERLRTETIQTRICRNYINLDISCGSNKGKKLLIKDQNGEVVAKYTTGDNKFSYVKESILDISGMTSAKQVDALQSNCEYLTRAIKGEIFVGGKECQITWRNDFLPNPKEAGGTIAVYPMLSSDIYVYTVDNKSKLQELDDTYTVKQGNYAAFVSPSCTNVDENFYFNLTTFFNNKVIREHAGEFFNETMEGDTYSPDIMVYTERSSSSSTSTGGKIIDGLKRQDNDVTYKKYRVKYDDLLAYYCYSDSYDTLINYGKEPGKMVMLFASGSMMTYTTTDKDGYMEFWADPNKLNSLQFHCMSKDLKGTSGKVTIYKVVKVEPLITLPDRGLTLYNIPEGKYTVEFEDELDKQSYVILNNSFTVKDSGSLQTAPTISVGKEYFRLGDVNSDKRIDIEDAVMVIGHINGNQALTSKECRRADIDGNKVIDIEDAVAIIAHVNGVKPIS